MDGAVDERLDKVLLAHRSPHSPPTASPPRVVWITTTIFLLQRVPEPLVTHVHKIGSVASSLFRSQDNRDALIDNILVVSCEDYTGKQNNVVTFVPMSDQAVITMLGISDRNRWNTHLLSLRVETLAAS